MMAISKKRENFLFKIVFRNMFVKNMILGRILTKILLNFVCIEVETIQLLSSQIEMDFGHERKSNSILNVQDDF